MSDFIEGASSYIIVLMALVVSQADSILTWGGLLLLCVRLIADLPRAWAVLKKAVKNG